MDDADHSLRKALLSLPEALVVNVMEKLREVRRILSIFVLFPSSHLIPIQTQVVGSKPHRSKLFSIIQRILLIGIPFSIYIILLLRIPLPQSLSTPESLPTLTLTAAALARLILLGTIILGLLSGFGAVTSAWDYLPSFSSSSSKWVSVFGSWRRLMN